MSKFDLTIAFDKANYLNPQLYMFFDTLKDNIPEDTKVHIVTNRGKEDHIRKYIKENINSKIYFNTGYKTQHLNSRCRYMFNCFDIKSDADWIIKMEADMLILKHLSALENILEDNLDCVLETENRVIFDESTSNRLWRMMYRAMDIKPPAFKIEFRENKEMGLPLFGTGMICVRNRTLNKINERWIDLTKKVEPWLNLNVHPNEQAFTGLVLDENWKWKIYPANYKFNPIGHFRKGSFPSIDLIENCKLPGDTIILDYHRPQWLFHVAKYNPQIKTIIQKNKQHIPKEWWKLTNLDFREK